MHLEELYVEIGPFVNDYFFHNTSKKVKNHILWKLTETEVTRDSEEQGEIGQEIVC